MRFFMALSLVFAAACGRESFPLPARPVPPARRPACSYYQPSNSTAKVSTQDRCVYDGLEFTISDVPGSYEFFDGKPGVENVAGVGEKALWASESRQLAVVKEGRDLCIRAADKETAIAVAQAITFQ
jgi:hypothetical protein